MNYANQQTQSKSTEAICAHFPSLFRLGFLLGGSMKVGIIMGSKSDLDTMKKASAVLDEFNIPYEMVIASAHRTPEAVKDFVTRLEGEGAIAFIAGAGAAAHLPGVVASFTTLPVIGIPLNATALKGIDSLLAIVQMPSGMPVATMAVDGAKTEHFLQSKLEQLSIKT